MTTQHLDDRTLLDALEEGAGPREREHLQACAACAARRVRLAHDLTRLTGVLRDGPPPRPVAPVPGRGWMPLAATVAAGVLLALGLTLRTGPTEPVATAAPLSLRDVGRALFATDDVEQLTRPVAGDELAALEAALRGEWPGARSQPWDAPALP